MDIKEWAVTLSPQVLDYIATQPLASKLLAVCDIIVQMLADDPETFDGDPIDLIRNARNTLNLNS